MRTIDVFVDTSTVNRMLLIKEKRDNTNYEEDREYLTRIIEQYVESGVVRLIVNPTVRAEIEDTKDARLRARLLQEFEKCHFTPYNITIFPISFPVTFPSEEEVKTLKQVFQDIPSFKKDERIFAEAAFKPQIEVLLTTDRKHLANEKLRSRIQKKGLDKKIKVCTPKELFEHLQNVS